MLHDAVLPLSGTVSPPSHATEPPPVPLMENVTDPVGVPLAGLCGATVAVKVTGCPVTLGLLAEFSVVVVFPRWIVALRFPVLPLKLGSPEYEAETAYGESLACRPAVKVHVATAPGPLPFGCREETFPESQV